MSEAELRSALDTVVDRVIKKLDKKTFLESMPKVIKSFDLIYLGNRVLMLFSRQLTKSSLHPCTAGC